MFYEFSQCLLPYCHYFNIFKYLTFRSICAFMTSLCISLIIGSSFIKFIKKFQVSGQPIREDGPNHFNKSGTPTMGGLLIILTLFISILFWGNLRNPYLWLMLINLLGFSCIGLYDDILKIKIKNSYALSAKMKFFLQIIFATIIFYLLKEYSPDFFNYLTIPFTKGYKIELPTMLFFLLFIFILVGSSNAVNLTDGLDGLAIVPIVIVAFVFGLIAYLTGHFHFSQYLNIIFIKNSGELVIFCSALIGSGLGFLWFNAPPAKVFMGDTGSLSLGASLGLLSIIVKHELILAIVGGIFVVEAVSVIIQVFYFKCTGKRIFLMSPIHHHFEKKNWPETVIVIRFWIVSIILAVIGIASLKIR